MQKVWDRVIAHSHLHVSVDQLARMRHEVDDLGDDFARALNEHKLDLDTVLDSFAEQPPSDLSSSLSVASSTLLPIHSDNRIQLFKKSVLAVPGWVDPHQVRRGQCVYLQYGASAAMALLYYSLIGGFSAPKIVAVLQATGYLVKPDPKAAWRRLVETSAMLVDCMQGDGALEPVTGCGWRSVLRVRVMHSRVRLRLLASGQFDAGVLGQPINQEDMMATLLSFSINVLDCIREIGAPWLTLQEQLAYLHLWRYIGYLIGVRDEFNPLVNGLDHAYVRHCLLEEPLPLMSLSASIAAQRIKSSSSTPSLSNSSVFSPSSSLSPFLHSFSSSSPIRSSASESSSSHPNRGIAAGSTSSLDFAHGAVESVVLHLIHPDDSSRTAARNVILGAMHGSKWMPFPCNLHAEMARRLIGHSLADALELPRAPLYRPLVYFLYFLVFLLALLRAPFISPNSWLERTSRRKVAQMTKQMLDESGSKMSLYCLPPNQDNKAGKQEGDHDKSKAQ